MSETDLQLKKLHDKLNSHIEEQSKNWKSFVYAKQNGFYQGFDEIKIQGCRSTEKRFKEYKIEKFFDKNFKFEKIIVHGHSPEKEVINFPYRINVDTGSFFSGKLSCVCLNDKDKKREFIYS